MSEQVRKFVLVVRRNDLDDSRLDRLTEYMATLNGTSITHKSLSDKPEVGMTDRHAAVIVEWFSPVSPERSAWAEALSVDDDHLQWYAVSEALRWRRPGNDPSPDIGLSHICCVGRTAGLTMAQFEHHWTHVHRTLAQKYHVGMELYVQNVVRSVLSAKGQGVDGIAQLGFRTEETFKTGMYDSDEGRTAIAADVAKFVGTADCGLYQLMTTS
jgi:uncharacterized protein (TIGR02118 family)